VHHLGGQVLLLGVTHSESTTLHLAEAIARVPYAVSHPCVVEVDGVARTVMVRETDHCCAGFQLADEWLRARGLQREGKVGSADARLSEAPDLVKVTVEHLVLDPLVFLCSRGSGCDQCDAARASIRSADSLDDPSGTLRERQ